MSYLDERQDATQQGSRGVYLCNGNYNGNIEFPVFKSSTIFRPLGPPVADHTNVIPTRKVNEHGELSPRPRDYSGWITAKKIVRGVGTADMATFSLHQLDESGNFINTRDQRTPYDILYKTVRALSKRDQSLESLFRGGDGRGAALPQAKACALIQGALTERKGEPLNPPVLPCLLVLPFSATTALENLLEEETDEYKAMAPEEKQAAAHDARKRFKYWDLLNYDSGQQLMFYGNRANIGGSSGGGGGSVSWDDSVSSGNQASGGSRDFARYLCKAVPCDPLPRNSDGTMLFETQNRLFQPWSEILRYLSDEEMADILVRCFMDKPDLLREAFGNYGWLPASIATGQVISTPTAPQAAPAEAAAVHQAAPAEAVAAPQETGTNWAAAANTSKEDRAKQLKEEEAAAAAPAAAVPGVASPEDIKAIMEKISGGSN